MTNISSRPWFPPLLIERLKSTGEVDISGRFPPAVKKILRKRRPMRVSKWAEKYRVATMSTLPGPWRNEVTPYLLGIMDASTFSSVETIIVCKAPQVGMTEAVFNFIGYCIDRDPGPVLCVFPDEMTARENSKDRIQPMITSSPRLADYLTGSEDDLASMRINLIHMPIYLAWARSAARLANKPIKYLIFDEIDKYPDTAGKREADPISLGEKRAITFKGARKKWKFSSPTVETAPTWQALTKEARVIFDFWVKCPFCGKSQLMIFDRIKWPEDCRDPIKIKAADLARYECAHCQWRWSDEDRNRAVRRGLWRARTDDDKPGLTLRRYLVKHRPGAIGFHLPSWLSRFVGLSEVAAAFLEGLKDKSKLKDFMNAHKAEPWRAYTVERTEDAIIALRDDRPRGIVPGGDVIAGLTAAVDTQDNGFFYEIRAWGYGPAQESWQIREGFLSADWRKMGKEDLVGRKWPYHPAFDVLRQVLWEDHYADAAGNEYLVHFTVMDAMGHHTSEVYDFCRHHKGRILALQGVDKMTDRYRYSDIDRYPGTNKAIPGGVKLFRINVTNYKNQLSERLEIAPADPGAWHMHKEMTEAWASQMTAEFVNEKGLWEQIPGRANHAWDVSVYNLACADVIGVRHWAKKEEKQGGGDQRSEVRKQERGGDWVPRKKNWVRRR